MVDGSLEITVFEAGIAQPRLVRKRGNWNLWEEAKFFFNGNLWVIWCFGTFGDIVNRCFYRYAGVCGEKWSNRFLKANQIMEIKDKWNVLRERKCNHGSKYGPSMNSIYVIIDANVEDWFNSNKNKKCYIHMGKLAWKRGEKCSIKRS